MQVGSIKEQFKDRVREMCGDVDFEPHEKHTQPQPGAAGAGGEYGEGMYGADYGGDQFDDALGFD